MKNEEIPDVDQALHERLCAYVFGELQGAERAAFEAELLRSPELQRERARLSATIELVKSAVPDEGLSVATRRDIVASARRSRFRFLSGRSIARVAAAVVLLGGGFLAVRYLATDDGPFTYSLYGDDKVARVKAPEKMVERKLGLDQAGERRNRELEEDALRGLGYVGGGAAAPAAPQAVLHAEAPADSSLVADGSIRSGTLEDLKALGYGGGESELSFGAPASAPAPAESVALYALTKQATTQAVPEVRESMPTGVSGSGSVGHRGTSAFAAGRAGGPGSKSPVLPALQELEGSRMGAAGGEVSSNEPAAETLTDAVEELGQIGYGLDDEDESRKDRDRFKSRRERVLTREQVVVQVDQLLAATRVAPGESPRDMFFRYWGDSPFVPAEEQTLSTFAVDVDTASYALARAYLNRGELPPRAAVRTEEFVNYFKADQPPPSDGKPFAIGLELAPSLFAKDSRAEMLRVTVRGKDVADFERKPVNLTFVIDNSGSMREGDRLELVKRSLALLLRQLGGSDAVGVVKFSNSAAVVTPMISAARRGELEQLIGALPIEGGTNVEAGLRLGYEQARQGLSRNAVNRVILCSDGVGNIGETNAKSLLGLVDEAREQGIYLNTVGVGMGNHNDAFLEELADKGDGVCNYVDSDAEAKRVFVDNLASAIQPIARDVKIQVEFDPAQVESWRLLGYENRALRTQDFKNDAIDAGEVNAGHQVSALYELVRRPSRSAPLATVRVRYKPPFAIDEGREGAAARADSEQATEIERTLSAASVLPGFAGGSNGYQRAVLVAQFAEVLRQSVHARADDFATLLRESRRLRDALRDPDFSEFVGLLERANPLLDERAKQETPRVQELLDRLSQLRYEEALRERRLELGRQAGEPAGSPETDAAAEQAGVDARAAIQGLEDELRAELEKQLEPAQVK